MLRLFAARLSLGSIGCQPVVAGSLPAILEQRSARWIKNISAGCLEAQAASLCFPELKSAGMLVMRAFCFPKGVIFCLDVHPPTWKQKRQYMNGSC